MERIHVDKGGNTRRPQLGPSASEDTTRRTLQNLLPLPDLQRPDRICVMNADANLLISFYLYTTKSQCAVSKSDWILQRVSGNVAFSLLGCLTQLWVKNILRLHATGSVTLNKWMFLTCEKTKKQTKTGFLQIAAVLWRRGHRWRRAESCWQQPERQAYAENFPSVWSVLFSASGRGVAAFFFSRCESSFADGGRRMHMAAWPSRMTLGLEMNPTVTPSCCTISSRADSCGRSGEHTQCCPFVFVWFCFF